MKATIIRIEHNRVDVLLGTREYGLDLFHWPAYREILKVGQTIEVCRQINNPFLVPQLIEE